MEEQRLFGDKPFMEKEALELNPRAIIGALKGAGNLFRRTPREPQAGGMGKFVHNAGESTVNPENVRMFDEAEVQERARKESLKSGTGSFVSDALLGITKRVVPKTKEPIENFVGKAKETIEGWDTAAGKVLSGKDPDSLRGKLFSSKVGRQVGEITEDGSTDPLMREGRRPSLIAPIENTVKVTTPFLATAYVADKLYPPNKQQESTLPPYEDNLQKTSYFDESFMEQMDKIASMQKIAELEECLNHAETELEKVAMEKTAVEKRLENTIREKESLEKRASLAEENLLEKVAEFEELRLRTIAKERSKVAVELAEQLLEAGIVKQAHLNDTIDNLMECDEGTINMYSNMVKEGKRQDESLESLAFLSEYKSNDKLVSNSDGTSVLSKRGQTIGEAARDLNKR
jgi:hypothetical protein